MRRGDLVPRVRVRAHARAQALGELRVKCNALGSAQVAACQGSLLANSPGGLLARQLDLMQACLE